MNITTFQNKSSTWKLVFLSLLTAIGIGIYVVEAQIPMIFPGVKLGLSNVISLVVLLVLGFRPALTVSVLRVTLGSVLIGSMSAFIFSITGALLSLAIMTILYKIFHENISVWAISMAGAICHNIGQLTIACFVLSDVKIFFYLPVLGITAIITGFFIGIVTKYMLYHLKRL